MRVRFPGLARGALFAACLLASAVALPPPCRGEQDATAGQDTRPSVPPPATEPAKPEITVPSPAQISEEAIRLRVKEISDAGPGAPGPAEQRKALLNLYNGALEDLRRAKESHQAAEAYEQFVKDAPEQLRRLQEAASQPASRPAVTIPQDMPLDQMEAQLKAVQLELADVNQQARKLKAELRDRLTRRTQLPKKIADAKDKLKEIQARKAIPEAPGESQAVRDAQQAALRASEMALQAELNAGEKENATYETRGALLRAQQEALPVRASELEAAAAAWRKAVHDRRLQDAQRELASARQAAQDAAGKNKVVQRAAAENVALAGLLVGPEGLLAKQEQARLATSAAKGQLDDLEQSFQKVRDLVAGEAPRDVIDAELGKLRAKLPNLPALRKQLDARDAEIAKIQLKLSDLGDRTQDLGDLDAAAGKLLAKAQPPVPATQPQGQEALAEVRKALEAQKALVVRATKACDGCFHALLELKAAEKQLLEQSERIAQYEAKKEAPGGTGEPKVVVPSAPKLTEEAIGARIKALAQAPGLSDEARKTLEGLYNAALEEVRGAGKFTKQAQDLEQAAKDAPEQIRKFRQAKPPPEPKAPRSLPLENLENSLRDYKLELAKLEGQSTQLAATLKARARDRTDLPKKLTEAQTRLKETQDKLATPDTAEKSPQAKEAQQALLQAKQEATGAEIAAYQKELAAHEVLTDLLRAQQEDAARRTGELRETIKVWQEAVSTRRAEEDKRQLAEARKAESEAARKHEIIERIAKQNTALVELRTGPDGLTAKQKEVTESLARVQGRKWRLEKSFEKIKALADEEEPGDLTGILLEKERASLPDLRQYEQRLAERRAEISKVRQKALDLSDLALKLSDVSSLAERMVAHADPPVPKAKRAAVLEGVRKALTDQKEFAGPLRNDYEAYSNSLLELDAAEKQSITLTQKVADYIDERILWFRSAAPLSLADAGRTWDALRWLAGGISWRGLGEPAWEDLRSSLAPVIVAVLVLGALVLLRRRLARAVVESGKAPAAIQAGASLRTLWALLLTVLLAGVGPAAIAFVGWRLASARAENVFAFAFGKGLLTVAEVWFPIAVLRQTCRPRGLAHAHFRWPAESLHRLRRSLLILMAICLPLVLLASVMAWQDVPAYRDSLGRLALMALLVILAVHLGRLLRPRGRLVRDSEAARKGLWVYRLRHVWYPLVVVAPPSLALAAAAGFYYTAVQLSWRLLTQLWVVVGLLVLQALLGRWILNARRHLALRALSQRRRAEPPSQALGPDKDLAAKAALEADKDAKLDISAVSAQTQQIVRYLIAALLVLSVWGVWSNVLPALGALRRVELWTTAADGVTTSVTLASLGLAILTIILTVVAGRNIPGMLEITVLQRLHVDAGIRYAVNHLARYVISITGIVIAFQLLGVKWQHVQWLVAAITVGLGFGLQEIFGNFVSGLILLFERPIRVGDVVTVGEVTGTVTRIRIRATTITSWDRKELIVPNKEFVTGRLVNWTLSDKVVRIVIPVGIAYGSDTQLAAKLLVEVAKTHEHVLDDPEPYAVFLGFGDSSLNFELRVYVDGLDSYLAVLNDMHMGVDRAFREAGIEIAFPQRDVHIRSIQGSLPIAPAGPGSKDAGAVDPPRDM